VAYHSEGAGEVAIRIRGGYLLDRVIAGPEDQIGIHWCELLVNGVPFARLRLMPVVGSLRVPEKTWLIWPSLHTVTRNNVGDDVIAGSVLGMAMVPPEGIIGRPFGRWFWRKQNL